MGTMIGHVGPGFGFALIGFWHMYNHLKLLALRGPNHYKSLNWFPTRFLRYFELYVIMLATSLSVAMELFIGPERHQPLDSDWTIPSNHLHNFEHSSISLTFFVYALFSFLFDRYHKSTPLNDAVVQLLGAIAFGQQLLLFHLHSTDHMGVEGQYHWLLQLVIFVSLATTLLGIGYPTNFIIAFMRSLSIFFQGLWLMIMGFALWTPSLIPKGCFMNEEEGHKVVRCEGEMWLHRAIALANIEFSWFLILLAIFAASFYVIMMKIYAGEKAEYQTLTEDEDVEAQKIGEAQNFVNGGRSKAIDHMER